MSRFYVSFYLILCCFPIGCSHTPHKDPPPINTSPACTQTLDELTHEYQPSSLNLISPQNLLAYGYTGINYATEFVWDATAISLITLGSCAPTIALLMLTEGQSYSSISAMNDANVPVVFPSICLGSPQEMYSFAQAPPLGRYAWKTSRPWRCRTALAYLASLDGASACYQGSANEQQLSLILMNLDLFSSNFHPCLEEEDILTLSRVRKSIVEQLQRL